MMGEEGVRQDVRVLGRFKPDCIYIQGEKILPTEDLVAELQERLRNMGKQMVLIAVLLAFLRLYCVCFNAAATATAATTTATNGKHSCNACLFGLYCVC